MANFYTSLYYADRICDYIPIISTISNSLPKLILWTMQPTQSQLNNRYIQHISTKSAWYCGISAIPIVGNVAIAIFNLIALLRANNPRKLVNEEAERIEDPYISEKCIKGTISQYTQGNNSACTRYSCLFLQEASNTVTQESIDNLLRSLQFGSYQEQHENTEDVLKDFPNLLVQNNPFLNYKTAIPATNSQNNQGLSADQVLNYLLNEKSINAALITSIGITIAMQKQKDIIEFFDPHGDIHITGGEYPVAYVYRCSSEAAYNFLLGRFFLDNNQELEDNLVANTIFFWPLQVTK